MALEKTEDAETVTPVTEMEKRESIEDLKGESEESNPPEWQDLLGSGSILKKILKEGEPDSRPTRQQKCVVSYVLSLADNEGAAIEEKDNFELHLGDCDVVPGLDVALGLMNTGEKAILKIEGRLGFGDVGLPPHVPPSATIVYEIELKSVEEEKFIEEFTVKERKELGNKKRERGNWWYGRGDNTLAIQCYRRALDYLDEVEGGINLNKEKIEHEISDSALQELLEDRVSVYNNMAAAQIKLELYDAALTSLQTVLRCQPNNVKALFRKAKVHRAKNDLNAALKSLKKADDISPNNTDVQKEIISVNKLLQKHKVTERELAKRMFGEPISSAAKENKSKRNMLVWSATLAASFAVGLAGVAAYKLKFT